MVVLAEVPWVLDLLVGQGILDHPFDQVIVDHPFGLVIVDRPFDLVIVVDLLPQVVLDLSVKVVHLLLRVDLLVGLAVQLQVGHLVPGAWDLVGLSLLL